MRFDTGIALKRRYTKVFENFRGVDLSGSPLHVAANRATESYNLICDNGVNHKRPGWRELLHLNAQINGIFSYREEGEDVLLIHAGENIYRARMTAADRLTIKKVSDSSMKIKDARSQCFYRNGFAYLVGCGSYLAYGKHGEDTKYSLKKVSEVAYVPTTTVGRDYLGADRGYRPYTKEGVNLLTPYRKNTFVGAIGSGYVRYYVLDGPIDANSSMEFSYDEDTGLNERLMWTVALGEENAISFSATIGDREPFITGTVYRRIEDENRDLLGLPVTLTGGVLALQYHRNFSPQIEGDANFTVMYSSTTEGNCEKIEKCKIGAMFGVDGASDRLFLSGNFNYPNKDFFSEAGDLTYFPDGNVLTVGDEGAEIVGYARLSDETLGVFKSESLGDAAIYYRTGVEKSITDADGHTVSAAFFPTVAGTAGEFLVAPQAVANLSGDVLMLSQNGVFGIELAANIASVERYAKERSRLIFEDLKKRDLAAAVGAVYRGRYYLAVPDKEENNADHRNICYVADARYRANVEGSTDLNYEWWVWDNIPARVFAIFNEGLLFGTAEGRVCMFHEEFEDCSYTEIKVGEVAQQEGGYLTFSDALALKTGDRVMLYADLYVHVETVYTLKDGRIAFSEERFDYLKNLVYDGAVLYADRCAGCGLASGIAYIVSNFDPAGLTFSLLDPNGKEARITGAGFRLSKKISGEECELYRYQSEYYLCTQGGMRVLIDYNGVVPTQFAGRVVEKRPVVASWTTPVLDFGTCMDRKSLLGITLATAPIAGGDISFGYQTRKRVWEGTARNVGALDFNALDFNYFTFDAVSIASSYTKRLNVRNFNYIRFCFRSESKKDCAVNGITVYYKINQTNRGIS